MRSREPARPFGRLVTATVTPFRTSGELDLEAAAELAAYLVDVQRNDTLIVNGTTGEGPTTSDPEKSDLIRAARAAVGDRAQVVSGVGTFDTTHTVHLAEQAEQAGADGLLWSRRTTASRRRPGSSPISARSPMRPPCR